MKTRVIKVRSEQEVASAAAAGARALKAGKLVGFATETVYGLAAEAAIPQAMKRLRELKSRPARPFSVHVGRAEEAQRYVSSVPSRAARLMSRAWPGPVTLLLPTGGKLADGKLQAAGLGDVLCWHGMIGLRCPEPAVARAMLSAVEMPVVAPSANPAGRKPPRDAEGVLKYLDGRIELLIDSGPTRYGKASTVVKFTDGHWRVVRPGALAAADIRRMIRRTIVFVCTGNTCRSAMAAGIAKTLLARREGMPPAKLARADFEVISAGLWAADGMAATPEAVRAAGLVGADISAHRSRRLTKDLIKTADLIFCMTEDHVAAVCRMVPAAADKARRLDGRANIPDPIGGGINVYRRTAERIGRLIADCMDRGLL